LFTNAYKQGGGDEIMWGLLKKALLSRWWVIKL